MHTNPKQALNILQARIFWLGLRVSHLKVLIFELGAVDGLPAGAVALGEVPSLASPGRARIGTGPGGLGGRGSFSREVWGKTATRRCLIRGRLFPRKKQVAKWWMPTKPATFEGAKKVVSGLNYNQSTVWGQPTKTSCQEMWKPQIG